MKPLSGCTIRLKKHDEEYTILDIMLKIQKTVYV